MSKLKTIVILQAAIIIILLIYPLYLYRPQEKITNNKGLLSPRVYAGVLDQKSYLITNFQPLKNELMEDMGNNNLSIHVENLRDGASFDINDEKKFPPLSLNKVPLAILVMQKVESGKLNLNTLIPIKDELKDAYFGDLYNNPSKELPLRFLMEKMLSESDNTAFFVLLEYLDKRDLKLLLEYYPIDFKYYYNPEIGHQTTYLTTKEVSNVFRSLYLSTLLNAKNSEYLLGLLENETYDIKNKSKLPDDVRVVHKFGLNYVNQNKYLHDCGIMYIPLSSRILYCIMTDGLEKEDAHQKIGTAINKIYGYIVETRDELSKYRG